VTPVTLITANATQDEQTDADYIEMYQELRENRSLDQFVGAIASTYSKAQWSKYGRGDIPATRTMRQELRAAVGIAPLPPTLHEVADGLDPDTEVVQVGDASPNRMILTGLTGQLVLSLDGSVAVVVAEAPKSLVTSVTRHQGAKRDKRHRLTVSADNVEWLREQGWSADEAIDKMREGMK